jgi:hypothetical protein
MLVDQLGERVVPGTGGDWLVGDRRFGLWWQSLCGWQLRCGGALEWTRLARRAPLMGRPDTLGLDTYRLDAHRLDACGLYAARLCGGGWMGRETQIGDRAGIRSRRIGLGGGLRRSTALNHGRA